MKATLISKEKNVAKFTMEFTAEEFEKIELEIDKLYCKANGKLSKLAEKILKDGAQ